MAEELIAQLALNPVLKVLACHYENGLRVIDRVQVVSLGISKEELERIKRDIPELVRAGVTFSDHVLNVDETLALDPRT